MDQALPFRPKHLAQLKCQISPCPFLPFSAGITAVQPAVHFLMTIRIFYLLSLTVKYQLPPQTTNKTFNIYCAQWRWATFGKLLMWHVNDVKRGCFRNAYCLTYAENVMSPLQDINRTLEEDGHRTHHEQRDAYISLTWSNIQHGTGFLSKTIMYSIKYLVRN